MAGRNIRNKAQLSPLRSYIELSKHEVDRVNSALVAAANFGQPETQGEDLKNLDGLKCDQDLRTKESNSETGSGDSQTTEAPKILRRSCRFSFEPAEDSESEPASGSSKSDNRNLLTLTINRKNRHRLETALKLLEFVEGGGNDSDSDFSLNLSESSSTMFLNKVGGNNKTSTPRLQALKDRTCKNY